MIKRTVDGRPYRINERRGRKKVFDEKYGQRLFAGDSNRIKAMGYSRTDFVRLATHKFLSDLENNGDTELVKP